MREPACGRGLGEKAFPGREEDKGLAHAAGACLESERPVRRPAWLDQSEEGEPNTAGTLL